MKNSFEKPPVSDMPKGEPSETGEFKVGDLVEVANATETVLGLIFRRKLKGKISLITEDKKTLGITSVKTGKYYTIDLEKYRVKK